MRPIAVFYHGFFGTPYALQVTCECMAELRCSGLMDVADEIYCSYNGPSKEKCQLQYFPHRAQLRYHGPESFSENLTIDQLHRWSKQHNGWNVLYFHAKGSSHTLDTELGQMRARWRACLLANLVRDWRDCVEHLNRGKEMVTCHWLVGMVHGTQNIPGGNFLWVTSEFVATLPSFYERDRIKVSGIASLESRFEAEVFWGNGRRLPKVVDKHPGHPRIHFDETVIGYSRE